jgi:hypothetical protein
MRQQHHNNKTTHSLDQIYRIHHAVYSDCSGNERLLSVTQKQVGDRQRNNVRGGKRNTGGDVSMTSKNNSNTSPQSNDGDDNDGDDDKEEEYNEPSKTLKSNNKRKAGKAQKPRNKDDDEQTYNSKTRKVTPRRKVASPTRHDKEDNKDNVASLNDAALNDVDVEEEEEDNVKMRRN